MTILKAKTQSATKPLTVRIPSVLHSDLEQLRVDADAAGLTLDVGEIVSDSLTKAIKAARAELKQYERA